MKVTNALVHRTLVTILIGTLAIAFVASLALLMLGSITHQENLTGF